MKLEGKIKIGAEYNIAKESSLLYEGYNNPNHKLGAWRNENYPTVSQATINHYSKVATAYGVLTQSMEHTEALQAIRKITPTLIYQLTEITPETLYCASGLKLRQEEQYTFYILNFGKFYKLGVASDLERRQKEHEYHIGANEVHYTVEGDKRDILKLESTLKWMFRSDLGAEVGLLGEETFHIELLEDLMSAVTMLERGLM